MLWWWDDDKKRYYIYTHNINSWWVQLVSCSKTSWKFCFWTINWIKRYGAYGYTWIISNLRTTFENRTENFILLFFIQTTTIKMPLQRSKRWNAPSLERDPAKVIVQAVVEPKKTKGNVWARSMNGSVIAGWLHRRVDADQRNRWQTLEILEKLLQEKHNLLRTQQRQRQK